MTMSLPGKLLLPCAAAIAALSLSACGGSSKTLIPSGNAGPLRRDFEAVASAAAKGNGNCGATHAAISKMERHFSALPASVDVALREKLEEGIENLSAKALALCEQPSASAKVTRTVETVSTPTSTRTSTTETETEETETLETETLSSSSGGGAEAPEEAGEEAEGEEAQSGGTGVEAPGASEAPPSSHGGAEAGGVGAP
jgi:hypothetical protein